MFRQQRLICVQSQHVSLQTKCELSVFRPCFSFLLFVALHFEWVYETTAAAIFLCWFVPCEIEKMRICIHEIREIVRTKNKYPSVN